jgi:hypothetical protein
MNTSYDVMLNALLINYWIHNIFLMRLHPHTVNVNAESKVKEYIGV